MARFLIQQAHGGQVYEINDSAYPFFPGWVIVDTLDDFLDDSPLYLSKAASDFRYAKTADLLAGTGPASAALKAATLSAVGFDPSGRISTTKLRRLSALPAPPIASAGGAGLIAYNSSSTTGYSSRSAYVAAVDATDIQLCYSLGFFIDSGNTGETLAGGTNTIKAAIEVDGTRHPVTSRGSRTAPLDPGGLLSTDPIALDLPAGKVFYVWTYISAPNGTLTFINTACSTPTGGAVSGTVGFSTGDVVDSGTITNSDAGNGYFSPIVCGQPTGALKAIVGLVGDSITVGLGTTAPLDANPYWKRALNSSYPAVQYAKTGAYTASMAASHRRGFPLLQGCTHALVMLGTNDLQNGRTATQLQADLLTVWRALASRGMAVIAGTLLPNTTSTDSWATLAGQTPRAGFAVGGHRSVVNAWLRDGAPILNGTAVATGSSATGTLRAGQGGHPLLQIMETADAVESARDSGVWKVNGTANYMTGDGVHPKDPAATLMAGVVPLSAFTV